MSREHGDRKLTINWNGHQNSSTKLLHRQRNDKQEIYFLLDKQGERNFLSLGDLKIVDSLNQHKAPTLGGSTITSKFQKQRVAKKIFYGIGSKAKLCTFHNQLFIKQRNKLAIKVFIWIPVTQNKLICYVHTPSGTILLYIQISAKSNGGVL